MTNLPKTLPAGTVLTVPTGPMQLEYTYHTLTAPLHILDEGMVEAVRKAIYRLRLESSMWADVLEHAFAHVLTPPVVEENTKTVREQLEETGDVGPRWLIVADAIDAVIARLDKAGI